MKNIKNFNQFNLNEGNLLKREDKIDKHIQEVLSEQGFHFTDEYHPNKYPWYDYIIKSTPKNPGGWLTKIYPESKKDIIREYVIGYKNGSSDPDFGPDGDFVISYDETRNKYFLLKFTEHTENQFPLDSNNIMVEVNRGVELIDEFNTIEEIVIELKKQINIKKSLSDFEIDI